MPLFLQEVFKILFGDAETILAYHRSENHANLSVGQWQNNQRVVVFATPLKAPEFVKSWLGEPAEQWLFDHRVHNCVC